MAVAFDTGKVLFDNNSITSGHAFASTDTFAPNAGTNRATFVCVGWSNDPNASKITSITDSLSQVYSSVFALSGTNSNSRMEIWVVKSPSTAATTITVNTSPDLNGTNAMHFGAANFTGVDQTTPGQNGVGVDQAAGPSTITQNVNSVSGNMIVDIVCNGSLNPTVNTDTLIWSGTADGSHAGGSMVSGRRAGAGAATADTWNIAVDSAALVSIDIKAAGAAGSVVAPRLSLLGVR